MNEFNPNREIYTPPSGPPNVMRPSPQIFEEMGVENIMKMAEDFYLALAQSNIRELFPEDIISASRRQGLYLVMLFGGPDDYVRQNGHPRLRGRHLPFEIDEQARQSWLSCFKATLERPEKYSLPEQFVPEIILFLEEFSAWMVNKK